uniref:CAF17 C-terminal domain-containing protein n=1 Tax=Anopheles atroparvus TaxID=41427 RepID=A0AAG5DK21_ANOAO
MLLRRSIVGTFARSTAQPLRGGLLHTSGTSVRQQSGLPAKSFTVQPLVDRAFIRVHGADSGSFLQGLMTNDMRHFAHCDAIYAMFLKANGRVFCDALIYKQASKELPDDYLLECDSSVAPRLEKHLRMYRLKKKVQVMADESFRLWVAFRNGAEDEEGPSCEETTVDGGGQLQMFKDPRLARLGCRVVSSASDQAADTMEQLHKMFPGATMVPTESGSLPYNSFRYSLGVGEGAENLPDGKCFPLECNCDYLHGVSFHKGCYIGQELTARTYHTGVIRKRLMPLEFDASPTLTNVPPEALRDAEIKNQDGAVVGKLRGLAGNFGLALLRIEKVPPGGELSLNVAGVSDPILCVTRKPFWWPKETNARH